MKTTILFLLLSLATQAQTIIPECGMTVRDTLVTKYVDFGSCNLLIMSDASYLKLEYLQGSGDIRYTNPDNTTPIIEFTTCYPYQQGNVHIDSSITIIQPANCETLSVEDVNPNDQTHLLNLDCIVYNVLGQKIYSGKYKNLQLYELGIYYIRFEYFSTKYVNYETGNG